MSSQCENCGKNQDKDLPLFKVSVGNRSWVLCRDCSKRKKTECDKCGLEENINNIIDSYDTGSRKSELLCRICYGGGKRERIDQSPQPQEEGRDSCRACGKTGFARKSKGITMERKKSAMVSILFLRLWLFPAKTPAARTKTISNQ